MLSEVVTSLEEVAALDDVSATTSDEEGEDVVLCILELLLVAIIDVLLNCADELKLGLDETGVELLCTCDGVEMDEVTDTTLVVEMRRVELDGTDVILLCVVTTGAPLEVA